MGRPKRKLTPAAARKSAAIATLLNDDIEEADDSEADDDEETKLSRILLAIGAESDTELKFTVSRHREGTKGKKFNYCFSAPGTREEAIGLWDTIKEQCGGGMFRVRLMRSDGTFAGGYELTIEGEPIIQRAPALPAIAAPIGAPASAATDTALQTFMAVSAENQRALITALQPKQSDPIQLFKEFAAITSGLRIGNAEASGAGMIGIIKESMTLAREMQPAGDGGGGSNVWDVVKSVIENPGILDGLKVIAENMRSSGVTIERPRPAIAAAPGPPIPEPAAPAAAEASGAQLSPQEMLDTYVPLLIQKARVKANPALYAEFLLDNLVPDMARALVYQPDIFSVLTERFPEIAQEKQWFDKLLEELKVMLQDTGPEGTGDDVSAEGIPGIRPGPNGQTKNP